MVLQFKRDCRVTMETFGQSKLKLIILLSFFLDFIRLEKKGGGESANTSISVNATKYPSKIIFLKSYINLIFFK